MEHAQGWRHYKAGWLGSLQERGLKVLRTCSNVNSLDVILPSASLKLILVVCILSRLTWLILQREREGWRGDVVHGVDGISGPLAFGTIGHAMCRAIWASWWHDRVRPALSHVGAVVCWKGAARTVRPSHLCPQH